LTANFKKGKKYDKFAQNSERSRVLEGSRINFLLLFLYIKFVIKFVFFPESLENAAGVAKAMVKASLPVEVVCGDIFLRCLVMSF